MVRLSIDFLASINKNFDKEVYELKAKIEILKGEIEQLKKELLAKKEASGLFGRQRDDSFKSTLQTIIQTFDGKYLYSTIEEQAAHLLY